MEVTTSPVGILHPSSLYKSVATAVTTGAPPRTVMNEILVQTTAQCFAPMATASSSIGDSFRKTYSTPLSQVSSVPVQ